MTGPQRHNARADRIFEEARALNTPTRFNASSRSDLNATRKEYSRENRERAAAITGLLIQRAGPDRNPDPVEDFETALVDLLADARHFCDSRGLDYASVDKAAYRHYQAEWQQAQTGIAQ